MSEFPSFVNFDKNSRVNMRGFFAKYYDLKVNGDVSFPGTYWDAEATSYDANNRYWWIVQTLGKSLAHELGHSLNLSHIFGCDNTHVMNPDGEYPRIYFNEDEIGTANKALYLSSVRKYVMDCPIDYTNILTITDDEIWEYDIKLYSDVIIEPEASLTIKCKVSMPEDASIKVKNGGTLVLDEGHITKSCEGLWQGIEVWGVGSGTAHPYINDIYSNAYPTTSADHGVVYIKDGSIVEYARNAITTSKYDELENPTYRGGIVVAHGAMFLNCKRSVEFMQYDFIPDFLPNQEDDNISEFYRCNFEVNDNYPCDETFNTHISMWDVDGVEFIGNTFKDLRDVCTNNAMGIYSIDATYSVASDLCGGAIPCEAHIGSFEGLFKGIVAENSVGRPLDIVVGDIVFNDNYRGILLSNVHNSVLISNTFEIPDIPTTGYNAYGIYLEDCSGYQVENNFFTSFEGYDGASPLNAGVYVVNNSDAVTEVYRNTFEHLEAGVRVQTENSKLQIKCNTFSSPVEKYNIYVTNTGLLAHQGICLGGVYYTDLDKAKAMANNVFTHDCNNAEGDIKIFSGHPELKYRHHPSASMTPSCYTTGTTFVTPIQCQNTTSDGCPSKLPSGGTGYRLDGSNTLLTANHLWMQIQILTAEIEALRDLVEMQNADYELEYDAEYEVIENNDLIYMQDEKEKLLREAVDLFYIEGKIDSAILIIAGEDIEWTSRKIAELQIMSGNYAQAKGTVDAISSDSQENSDFKSLAGVLIAIGESGRYIDSLSEMEIASLQAIAGKQSTSGVAAENILTFAAGIDYPEMFDPDYAEEEEDFRELHVLESNIFVYPNPAENELIVDIHSINDSAEYTIEVFNISGKELYTGRIEGNAISHLDIATLPSGILIVKVLESNQQIKVVKIVHI